MLITFRKIPRGSKIYFQEPVFQTDVRGTCFLPASPYVMMDLWRLFKEQYKMVIRGHTLLPSLVNYGGTETPPGEETGLAASAALPGGPATSGDQGASAATHLISRSRGSRSDGFRTAVWQWSPKRHQPASLQHSVSAPTHSTKAPLVLIPPSWPPPPSRRSSSLILPDAGCALAPADP